MPELSQVYDALRKADAAGNTADAQKLADYIRSNDAPAKSEGNPFMNTFAQGVIAAKDIVRHPIRTLQASNPFSQLSDQEIESSPAYQSLVKKMEESPTPLGLRQKEGAFMEGAMNTLPGKVLTAGAGIIPEANIVSTVLGKWVNPVIAEKTGLTPEEVSMFEMGAGGALAGAKIIPRTSANVAADTIAHPIESASNIIKSGANIANKAIVKPGAAMARPVMNKVIESANPFTGEEGLGSALVSPIANEGARLGEKLGVNFSAGELTGNKTATGIEDYLANSPRHEQRFAEANAAKTDAIIGKFNETLNQIHSEPSSPEQFGSRVSDAYNSTINQLIENRRSQGSKDFTAAYEGSSPENKTILSNNLFNTLQQLKDEGNARLTTPSQKLGASIANNLLKKLSTKTQAGNEMASRISIKELGNGLSNFSEAAKKPGGTFDTANSAAMRRVYGRIFGALKDDLDAEINNPKGDPQSAALLKQARDNFASNSNKISDLQKTTLGNMIGSADHDSSGNLVINPEKVAAKLSGMQPSELRSTLDFLDKNHPDVANMGRRFILEQALEKAREGAGQKGAGGLKPFSKDAFIKNLPSSEKLNAMFGDKTTSFDIVDIASAMNRLQNFGAVRKGSDTAIRLGWKDQLMKIGKGAFYKSIISDSLVNDLLDPSKRRQIAFEARQVK